MKKKILMFALIPVEGFSCDQDEIQKLTDANFPNKGQALATIFKYYSNTEKILQIKETPKILTTAELKAMFKNNKSLLNSFACIKKIVIYGKDDFMDEFNNQHFKGNTDKYWLTYIWI